MVDHSQFALAVPFGIALLAIWIAPLSTLPQTRWRWQEMTHRLPARLSAVEIDRRLYVGWGLLPSMALLMSALLGWFALV